MDKLKEILVYRFWILLGVALIAPVIGWWIGSDAMATAIDARKAKIDTAYNKIPSQADELVNQVWIDGVQERNQEQQKAIDEAWQALAIRQEDLKTWPPLLADDFAKLGTTKPIPADIRTVFPREFLLECDKLYYIVNPLRNVEYFDEKTNVYLRSEREGIVEFAPTNLPPAWQGQSWRNFQPTSDDIRNAQEDLWLYRSLLEAIRNVNQDATSSNDAAVLVIDQIYVLSGLAKKGTGGGASRRRTSFGTGTDAMDGEGEDQGRRGATGGSNALRFIEHSFEGFFDLVGGGPSAYLMPSNRINDNTDENDDVGNNSRSSRNAGDLSQFRYYEQTNQYKTRAFNLELIIDHRRLPDLLAELSNCPWPVNIIRVQEKDMSPIGSGISGVGRPGARRGGNTGSRGSSNRGQSAGGGFGVEGAHVLAAPVGHSREALENRAYLVSVGITGTMRMFKTQAEAAQTETPAADGTTPNVETEPQIPRPSPPSELAEKFPIYEQLYGPGGTGRGPGGGRSFGGGSNEDT